MLFRESSLKLEPIFKKELDIESGPCFREKMNYLTANLVRIVISIFHFYDGMVEPIIREVSNLTSPSSKPCIEGTEKCFHILFLL